MERKLFDLTSSQNSIWLTEEYMSNTNINNVGGYLYINDIVDFDALNKALNLYVEKNDALQLRFCLKDGSPKQYLEDYSFINFNIISVNSLEEMKNYTKEMVNKPFNIINSRLFDFNMFKFPDGHGGFNANFHHLISDAWTMSLYISQVIEYYSCIVGNKEINLEPHSSYIDFISSEKNYLTSKRFQKDKEFWNNLFDSEPIFSRISKNTTDELDTSSRRLSFTLNSNLYNQINLICKKYNCSIYTFFMAIYSIYIAKLNSNHSPIIGTPVLNRSNYKEKDTSGMFISTVAFKTNFESDETFSDYLKDVALTQLSIFRHQKYPYDILLKDIKEKFDLSENLYDLVLSYQNARDDKQKSDIEYSSNWLFSGHISNSLEIHFYDMDNTGILDIYYDYQISKFTETDIFDLHDRIMEMVSTVIKNPEIYIKDINIVTFEETKRFLNDFNYTPFEYDKNIPLVKIFENNVIANPEKVAVIFENESLTYSELNNRANNIAKKLIDFGVKPNDVIGIMLNRSYDLLVCVWGILKAGGTYMLIDPALPTDRIEYMLSNSKSPLLITSSNINIEFEHKILLDTINFNTIEKNPEIKVDNNDSFCVIYTSGSTGTPKGVELKRISIINMVNSYKHFLYTDTCENFLSTSTVAFDMFIVENFVSILSNKTVILANDEEQKVPAFMSSLIKKHSIDFILSTPSKLELLLLNEETSSCLKNVKIIQLGGEVFKESLYNRLRSYTNAKIFNGYGPSECTACSSNKEIVENSNITIGKPFLNTRIYILNDDLNMLPIGYNGEMYISGDGVGKGYINRNDITSKAFIKDIYSNNIMYKTGDIGKYQSNGDLIYIGRKDSQIKLRGLRIELDEITNRLVKINNIINAVSVIKKVNNIDCICSYVVTKGQISEQEIKNILKSSLPYYMIPSHIIFMEELPITLNGKIDTKHLPDIKIEESTFIAPSTQTESKLSEIWCSILHMDKISIDSNFFDLGGDSLCSIKLVSEVYSKLNVKISIRDIFNSSTIRSLANYIDKLSKQQDEHKIEKATPSDSYPLSSAQKRIYFTVNMDPNNITYNTPGALLFDKHPDSTKLENCFITILNNHCAFKTFFVMENSNIVQKLVDKVEFNLEIVDEKEQNLQNIFNNFVKPFNLSVPPLFRAKLYNFEDGTSALFIDMHHIICDGQSINIFVKELCDLYNGTDIDKPSLDYIDYAVWENNNAKSSEFEHSKKYWLSKFSGEIPVLNMPTTYPRPNMQSFEGNKIFLTIHKNKKIQQLCKKYNSTPFTLLLSIYYILLYKYTGQKDIIVGTPIVGRDESSLYNIIGMFVNTLALRMDIDSNTSFIDFLRLVTNNCFSAFENQTYPFDELLGNLDITRDTSRNPLFDTMFIYQNEGNPEIKLNGLSTKYYTPDDHSSKFDFSLEIIPENENLNLTLEYCTKLFDKKFMKNFLLHYINILNIILNTPNISISDINMLSKNEKELIINKFNDNNLEYPRTKSIIELFEYIANKNPDNKAIIYNGNEITYRELDNKSSELAAYLISHGIKKGDIVSTLLPRSSNLIISMLGIMKCGGIYLPISTALPKDRIEYILSNSNSKISITDDTISHSEFNSTNLINLDQIDFSEFKNSKISIKSSVEDVIYIIYTSGSTGAPKGVQIANKNLNNFINSFNKLFDYRVNNTDICISTTSISFDVSIWEFFFTLLNGATLYLYPHESIEDIIDFCNTIINNKITMAYLPPNILQEIYTILSKEKVSLNKILVGVEPIKTKLIKKFFKLHENMKIVNGYGPTETTICCTAYVLPPNTRIPYKIVPVGKPLYNLKAYILDNDMQPVPLGVSGELYINGDNVGKGYLNNKELTSEKYIPNKFDQGIMYKTGDIVKWLPDGNIMFVGRNDNQIKIKGHRIELNEISNAILDYPTITKCRVLVKEKNSNKYLVAFFTASKKIVINDLRTFLSLKLPFYSIPNIIMQLDHFVLTPNGKIDSNYLKNLEINIVSDYEAPRNELEEQLAKLWEQYLGVDKVGINDNFFELGGDSLIAIKLQIEIFKLGININYSDIFTHPTIKELANKTTKKIFKPNLQDYDYSKINHLINRNTLPILYNNDKVELNNVLLTGVTGFIGVHILDKLLSNTNSNIYCLIRKKDKIDILSRLMRILHFYFGTKYDKYIGNRIKIVEGDIISHNFKLSDNLYDKIGNTIDCVINSAAIVKHYGNETLFDETNIKGVQNIIDFCRKFNTKLYHISTLSVSGNVFAEDSFNASKVDKKITFRENNLFIGQDLSNIYIYTKFIAERLILENVADNLLEATIIRLGNITNRYSDGKFQINVSENAFLNRLMAFINLKYLPDYLSNGYLEFTPVDCCADAICKIIENNCPYNILHIFNNNHINMLETINYLQEYGINVQIVDNKKFLDIIDNILEKNKNILSGIINDFNDKKHLVYESDITLNNDFTNSYLKEIDFKWPIIDKSYIFKYLDYLKEIKYLK